MSIFEKAARAKLRFDTGVIGLLTTEDLFDLPLTTTKARSACLDRVAQIAFAEIDQSTQVSFVNDVSVKNAEAELKLEVVKHIIALKKAENKQAVTEAELRSEQTRLKGLLAKRKEQADDELSVEQLEAKLAALNVR